MSKVDKNNIIFPAGILIFLVILRCKVFQDKIIYGGKLLLYVWNKLT